MLQEEEEEESEEEDDDSGVNAETNKIDEDSNKMVISVEKYFGISI